MGRCFYQDIAPTIRTRTDGANMDFIMEEVKVINPLKGQSDNGWHFEQQVYDAEGISRAVKAGEGSGNIPKVIEPISVAMRGRNPDNPSERAKSNGKYKQRLEMNENGTSNTITSVQKDNLVVEPRIIEVGKVKGGKHQQDSVQHEDGICRTICTGHHASTPHLLKTMVSEPMCSVHPNSHKFEFDHETSIKPISPALRATDYKAPHCVYEPRVEQVGNIYPDTDTFKNRTMGRVYSNEGLSPTINCCGGGDREPKVVETRYRIRKLTPRECFRLMGVDDADIDKIQASGISNSQQYKCAGNSIVVDVLYHIFRKMFVETENENDQLCLF